MTESTSPQVQLVVELTTRPGAQREMREAVDRLVAATHQEDRGVVRFEVGLDPDDDRRVLGYEIWASQDALDEHSAKAHTQEFKARARGPAARIHHRVAAGERCANALRDRRFRDADSEPGKLPNDVPAGADDLHGLGVELGLGPVLLGFLSGWSPDGSAPISTGSSARSPRLSGADAGGG